VFQRRGGEEKADMPLISEMVVGLVLLPHKKMLPEGIVNWIVRLGA
jgi:hypothetical protein